MSERKMITATYLVDTEAPKEALNAICRGQTVGNPSLLTRYETKEFLNRWSAKGRSLTQTHVDGLSIMEIRFPQSNFGSEGLSYLLSVLMGGQCDIDVIRGCRLIKLDLGTFAQRFPGPRYGIQGIRERLGIPDRPLVGGIVKPKIGLNPRAYAAVVQEMAEGGCDVIKEDEILANQPWCRMRERLELIAPIIRDHPILYLICGTSDGGEPYQAKAQKVRDLGPGFGFHLNIWSGIGSYLDFRRHSERPLFFQKSGDKVFTTGPFAIEGHVLYQLLHLAGCDAGHIGMYGGYLSESVGVLTQRIQAFGQSLPSFSCGLNPTLAREIVRIFGRDVLLMSGGWMHSQPQGLRWAIHQLKEAANAHQSTGAV